jgi:membrane associated rhomboid family serine protease
VTDPAAPDDRPAWLREATTPQPGQVVCYRHPDRSTAVRCARCNRPVCAECARPVDGGHLCPDDAGQVQRTRGLPGTKAPVVTWGILGLNGVVLVIEALATGAGGQGFVQPGTDALCRLGALNAAAIAQSGQWWRLLTVMVLHAGVIHFALNSYALYIYGPVLEQVLGRVRFLAVYVIAGLAGSAASFAINRTALGVGASGAIFGLLGALVAFFYRRRDRGGLPQLQGLLIVVALNLVLAATIPGIDNVAHVGGFLGGLIAMGLLEAAPAGNRPLQALALAMPVALAGLLVMYGAVTFAGGFNCAALG